MATDHYDIIIVGAGPAGSMAARSAAQLGAKVLLLERDPVVGQPVRCGEAVSIHNVNRLIRVNPNCIAAEVKGAVLYAPDGTGVEAYAADQLGAVLERALFDRYLAEAAAESGAEVLTRADVDGLILEHNQVCGVFYTRYGKRYAVRSSVVIGADGVDSRVGRWAGIHTQIASSDLESAYQMTLAGLDYDNRFCHFYLGNKVAPGGYVWVFPKGPKTASVGIGVEVRLCDAGMAYSLLMDFIKYRFGKASIVAEWAGGVPVSLPMKKPYGNGIILVGDAARHCNPLTGGGIYTAMVSGQKAGELAVEAVTKNDVSEKFLGIFNKRIEEDIIKVHKRSYRISKALGNLTDDNFNQTAREVLAIPLEKRTMRTIFLRGLAGNPRLVVDIIQAFVN